MLSQTEPIFQAFWLDGQSLGDRAGAEVLQDYIIGGIGLVLILEATRRSIGMTLPLLSLHFFSMPVSDNLCRIGCFRIAGIPFQRIVSQVFLHSQGAFGIALRVMFTYVFLFVLFGTLLERTGATDYVLNLARRVFGSSAGAPAKVAVLSSGMMGSLSGSAVANTATTGTFTIPLMRRSGFQPEVAGGIEAAASSGGALMPPIMGAAAYMMLEIVEPAVTYLEIIRAALLPAVLYYTGMLCMVHFLAKSRRRVHNSEEASGDEPEEKRGKLLAVQGGIFLAAFITLIGFLLMGATAFRAVSWSLLVVGTISLLDFLVRKIRKQYAPTETRFGISDLRKGVDFIVSPCERAAAERCVTDCRCSVCRYHLRCGDTNRYRDQVAVSTLTACLYKSDVGTVFPDDFDNYSGDGAAFIGLLPANGNLGGSRTSGFRRCSACSAFLYFLFWNDVDGDATRCTGGVCRSCDRGVRDNGDRIRSVQVRTRWFCVALRVCITTRITLVE